ncbi:hypothetical protein H5410_061489, partial [Solanum commersonii]
MFIAIRIKTRKEIQADTEVAILMMPSGKCLERSSLADIGTMLIAAKQPGLNAQNIHVDACSEQAVRGQNILYSSGSTHDSILQK